MIEESSGLLLDLEKQYSRVCQGYVMDHTAILTMISIQRAKIRGIFDSEQAAKYLAHRSELQEYGDSVGKQLARRTRELQNKHAIPSLKDHAGTIISDPENIVAVFENYYRTLYSKETDVIASDLECFLGRLGSSCPKFSGRDSSQLDLPITLEEVESG